MKFIITESQKDRAVFRYLDLLRFKQINTEDNVFFVNSEDDEYAKIRYIKKDGFCRIYFGLVSNISTFFNLDNDDSIEIIGRWVEDILQMKVSDAAKNKSFIEGQLKVRK